MRTTYIAGPMRGIPLFNFPAFAAAATALRNCGHFVLNPAEHDTEDLGLNPVDFPTGQFSDAGWAPDRISHFMRQALRWDTEAILRSTSIALLPGWEESEGANVELGLAKLLGLEVFHL